MTTVSLRRQTGFSLIELLLVLGVLAILLIAAFVVYPQVRERMQIDQEVKTLQFASAKLKSVYAADPRKCESLTQAQSGALKLFPGSTYDSSTNTYSNNFGGTYTVIGGAAGTASVNISYNGGSLQGSYCAPLLRSLLDTGMTLSSSGRPITVGTDMVPRINGGAAACPPSRAVAVAVSCR